MFSVTKKGTWHLLGALSWYFMLKLQQWKGFFYFFFTFRYSSSCLTLNILTFTWFLLGCYPPKASSFDKSPLLTPLWNCEFIPSVNVIVFCQWTTKNKKSCESLFPRAVFAVFPPYICMYVHHVILYAFLCGRMFAAYSYLSHAQLQIWKAN